MGGTGDDDHAFGVGEFAAFEFLELGFGVEMRSDEADGVDGAASMGDFYDFSGIVAVLDGPLGPHASDAGSGVDEHSVEIEEDCIHLKTLHGR